VTVTYNVAAKGGFKDPDIPTGTWANFGSITGWAATNSCGIEVQDHVAGTPYRGNQFVELNSNCACGVTQDRAAAVRRAHHGVVRVLAASGT
jgi:hypothetical protein